MVRAFGTDLRSISQAAFFRSASRSCTILKTHSLWCCLACRIVRCGCRISLVSTGPQLIRPAETPDRNWKPIAIAAAVIVAAVIALVVLGRGNGAQKAMPVSTPTDPYAANLPISNLAMSESSNLAGGKVTYLDGHIANKGDRTISGITVQVLFRNIAHEVAQNETQQIKLIRTRDPYIDIQQMSAAPLKPGDEQDFRLIFDAVTQDWDGAFPEIRIITVGSK
jgi:hypothetical protein